MALLLLILTFFILLRGFGASSLIFTIFNVFSNGSRQNFAEMRRDEKLRTQIETSRESEYFLGCTSRQVENLSTFLDANRDNSRFSTSWKFRDETGTRWDSRKKKSRNRDETILDPPLIIMTFLLPKIGNFERLLISEHIHLYQVSQLQKIDQTLLYWNYLRNLAQNCPKIQN